MFWLSFRDEWTLITQMGTLENNPHFCQLYVLKMFAFLSFMFIYKLWSFHLPLSFLFFLSFSFLFITHLLRFPTQVCVCVCVTMCCVCSICVSACVGYGVCTYRNHWFAHIHVSYLPQSCSALLVIQTESPCLQSSLTGSPVCWVSFRHHSASTLQYEGYRHVHRAPVLYGCWGSPYVFVRDTSPNGHLFDFLHAPTCTCTHTNFVSLKCFASQEAGGWWALQLPHPQHTPCLLLPWVLVY